MVQLSICFFVLMGIKFCAPQEDEEVQIENERKVKGQQYITQTMVAKVVGSNGFSSDFLNLLRNNSSIPIVVDNATLVDDGTNGTTSALITENIKTTVTRITIPLNTNFMDSDWYRETLKNFLQKNRVAMKNSTIEREYNESGPDIDLVILKLWAAATLRDNIITVFGTLLYKSGQFLIRDLHSSLVHLHNLIILRRVSTINFLDSLENMSFENPHNQFKILFQKLEKHVPKYLRSCVTYWLENLHTNAINITNILTDSEGVLVADFLSGIDSSALLPLKQTVLFPKLTVMGALSQNEELMGKMLSCVLSGISDKSLVLTRQLFAGILLHLPLNRLTPQMDEYERFFVDLVKKGNDTEEKIFTETVQNLNFHKISDPFELTKAVFKSLMITNVSNRELYESILIHIQQTTNTFALRDYEVMSSISDSEKINMEVLLSCIVLKEYPLDIVDAKDRLLYYIDKNYIDMEFVLRSFVKHQQSTPTDLLIAVLTRMEVRSLSLSPEVLSTVKSLKAHIIYKKALNNLRFTLSVVDIITLLLSFQSPNLPKNLRDVAADLRVLLHSEFIDVEYQLNKQSTIQCSRPRQCVIDILKYLLAKGQIRNKVCELKVRELLKLVDHHGEPLLAQRSLGSAGNCAFYDYGFRGILDLPENEKLAKNEGNFTKEIYPGKYSPSPYKNYNAKGNIYEKPIFISRLDNGKIVITSQSGEMFFTSNGPEMTDIVFDRAPIPNPGWINDELNLDNLLPLLDYKDRLYMRPLMRFLQKKDLIYILNITLSDYPTKGALLAAILARSLKNGDVFENGEQKNFIDNYMKLLEYTYKVLPPPPPVSSNDHKREVNLPTLLQAIPVPTDDISMLKLDILKSFLVTANLSSLTNEIDTNNYPSKGVFLKHLLQLLWTNGVVGDEAVRNSIRYFEDKVMTSGYGAQPIDWIIVMENISKPVSQ